MSQENLKRWYDYIETHNEAALADMLDDDVVFHSPVVHTPQVGKAITYAYLSAAGKVLGGDNFRYVGDFVSGNGVVLEFMTEIEGIKIDGIDMITWNDRGKITEFKVMVRPLQAVNKVHEMMGRMLEAMKAKTQKA